MSVVCMEYVWSMEYVKSMYRVCIRVCIRVGLEYVVYSKKYDFMFLHVPICCQLSE